VPARFLLTRGDPAWAIAAMVLLMSFPGAIGLVLPPLGRVATAEPVRPLPGLEATRHSA
jgi:hypothetical protein